MYFNDVNLFNIEKFVSNLDNLYAHLKNNHKEKLKEHMDLTYNYFTKLCKVKNLEPIFKGFEEKFLQSEDSQVVSLWKDILSNSIYMHDIGKINSDFQLLKMNNEKYKNAPQVDSNHSMLSSCIYFNYYFNKIKNIKGKEAKNILLQFLTLNSYIISKHHGSLDDFGLFKDRFLEKYQFYIKNKNLYMDYKEEFDIKTKNIEVFFKVVNNTLENFEKSQCWKCIDVYIYTRLLFSLLTACDFYATSNYQTGNEIEDFGVIEDVHKFYSIFKEGKIYSNIQKYRGFLKGEDVNPFEERDINELRTEMFLEAEDNLVKHMDENIFYLEAPTGSGKTNISVNLAFKLLEENKELNKIFYIFPFNTLVEQTKKSLWDIFKDDEALKREIAVINSITPILTEDKSEDNKTIVDKETGNAVNYDKALLDRQFLHYPIVLTTHVNFFTHLFGNSREAVFPLTYMANSVVILDEIQSYRNNIWKEIITFLKKYSDALNIKIIIMSATLPRLEQLVDSNESFAQLIENRNKYFQNPLFKDRVELDFSLLSIEENIKEQLLNKVIETSKVPDKNILIEFIKKKTAVEFYKDLIRINSNENLNRKILLITGDDNRVERNRIIDMVKTEKNIILVATQVIEAGVDIDMDTGFKDISILDSEEQFLGRINRSCKKRGSKVYFFNLDEATLIYKGDYRKEKSITLRNELIREILKNKDFSNFYSTVMERIDKDLNKENSRNIDEFRKEVILNLRYEEIRERMKLIDDERKEYTIFLNRDIQTEDGKTLVGSDVWDEYYDILTNKNLGYAEKKVKLSIVLEKMDYFTYRVNSMNSSYNKVIGNIFYIEDGEKYLIDGKFDREKFNECNSFEIIDF